MESISSLRTALYWKAKRKEKQIWALQRCKDGRGPTDKNILCTGRAKKKSSFLQPDFLEAMSPDRDDDYSCSFPSMKNAAAEIQQVNSSVRKTLGIDTELTGRSKVLGEPFPAGSCDG